MAFDDPGLVSRIEHHREIEAEIDGWGDQEVLRRLSGSKLRHGHAVLRLPGSNTQVFVKLLPLTALEWEHQHSTTNFFQLPTYYQYRLGSFGFGAWRELEVHALANRWVLSGQCPHFPLLHHWRIVPIVSPYEDDRTSMQHWGSDTAIQQRVSATLDATSSAALFLEYFPVTLGRWLRDRLTNEPDAMGLTRATEATLLKLLAFVNNQGLLHMDAHFENILTNGSQFFLGDYGLATSRSFRLDRQELTFYERHENFDRCTAITSLVHAIVSHYDSRDPGDAGDNWRQSLRGLQDGSHGAIEDVPAPLRAYLVRRGPIALAMGEFYRGLQKDLATEYPATRLQELLAATS